MNEMQVFESERFNAVRVMVRDGMTWFVAADVCRALEHSNSRMALERLDEDEKGVSSIYTPGGKQEMAIVNEPGLYALVLGSRKPEAKAFKRWITHEVIPSIKKHGGYLTPEKVEEALLNPDTLICLAQSLKQEQEARRALEEKAERDAPKVFFAESVESSKSEILIGELAKILKQSGANIGQNRLFEILRRDGFLISRKGADWNMPTQKSMELGVMRIKETCITHADGHTTVSKTPKITGKGQVYFVNRYKRA